jgi:mannose-6-phosphate isomerase-like protein (cupin superfamily)
MNALQLPFKFDATLILQEISQFKKEDYYDIYNPSVGLETLWSKHLIEPIGGPDQAPEFFPNEALLKCPYLLTILETFKCKKETFRIHTLESNAAIKPHRDIGFSFEDGFIRIHIPVQTNDQVQLIVNNEHIKMSAGECWYCNFNEVHEVKNKSNEPRTHLILDCIVNDWFKDVFSKSGMNYKDKPKKS